MKGGEKAKGRERGIEGREERRREEERGRESESQ